MPTLKEAGADVEAVLWSGVFAPKATPPAIVKKLEGELMRIARLPDVIARLKPLGRSATGSKPRMRDRRPSAIRPKRKVTTVPERRMISRMIVSVSAENVEEHPGEQFPERLPRRRKAMTDDRCEIFVAGVAGHHFIKARAT